MQASGHGTHNLGVAEDFVDARGALRRLSTQFRVYKGLGFRV